jgi:predicted ATPase
LEAAFLKYSKFWSGQSVNWSPRTDARYRLLETIRAYALRMLETAKERDMFRRRHAEYHLDQLKLEAARWAVDSE